MSIQQIKAGETEALGSSSTEQVGIGGFTTFAVVNDSTAYETSAPTSVVEDGSYIGDHLINAPIKLTISGEVSEVFIAEPRRSKSDSRVPTVGKVTSFIPGRTPSQVQRVAKIIDSAADRRRQINSFLSANKTASVSSFTGNSSSAKSVREQFIDFIEAIHYGKQLIAISMPYRVHEDMAITSVTITRDNQRKALTFSISAQKFRVAKTVFSDVSMFYKKPAPSVASQTAGTKDKGTQSPTSGSGSGAGAKKEKSVLSAVLGR